MQPATSDAAVLCRQANQTRGQPTLGPLLGKRRNYRPRRISAELLQAVATGCKTQSWPVSDESLDRRQGVVSLIPNHGVGAGGTILCLFPLAGGCRSCWLVTSPASICRGHAFRTSSQQHMQHMIFDPPLERCCKATRCCDPTHSIVDMRC